MKKEEKKKEKKVPDYIQECTDYICQSFSYSITLNSNTPSQAKANRLLLFERPEIFSQLQKQHKSTAFLTKTSAGKISKIL